MASSACCGRAVEPFSDRQLALLCTFADQAVIAIENVRLFTELEARNRDLTEALEQQTATAEILGTIASSPTDLQPVLDGMAATAGRLCSAYDTSIFRMEGGVLCQVGRLWTAPDPPGLALPVSRGTVTGRSVLDRQSVQVADLQAEVEQFPEGSALARGLGLRTLLSVPLLREDVAIGVILLRRREVQPFTNKQIALLKTFADQAAIAIENVRLFTELEARNQDLTSCPGAADGDRRDPERHQHARTMTSSRVCDDAGRERGALLRSQRRGKFSTCMGSV